MNPKMATRRSTYVSALFALAVTLVLLLPVAPAGQVPTDGPGASVGLTKLSTDTFTNKTSQHATQVEPDTFSFGSTMVAAFQSGRFTDGGSSDIGFATSSDGGVTWKNGFLPGITNVQHAGNPYDRVSDPSVAYEPLRGVWIIASLPIVVSGANIPAVIVSRSNDGINWDNPIAVTGNVASSDKDWIVCDTWSSSPHYGNCYVEWDDPSNGDEIDMSTSKDGGVTWGPILHPAGSSGFGLGGQPVVQPNGTVVVPFAGNGIQAFVSTNGGTSWSGAVTVSSVSDHFEAANLRSSALPSAAVDGGGTVYVVWQDCRFRAGCGANDIVMSTSTNGTTWSKVTRIPADTVSSNIDHFIPGIDADKTTSGSTAHLALTYYQYAKSNCTLTSCNLGVSFISSTNGGSTWSAPTSLTTGMKVTWLPSTTLGYMVGDYISTSYVNGKAFGVFAVAKAKVGSTFNEAMYTTASGLATEEGGPRFSSAEDQPIPGAKSDHGPRREQEERFPKKPPTPTRLKRVAR